MILTFAIEIALAVWVLWRYRQDVTTRLIIIALVLLALFQFAEFNVCTTLLGLDSLTWSRVGYAIITFLPPLGIHALYSMSNTRSRYTVIPAYGFAIAFATYFLISTSGLTSSVCGGNYVIFEVHPNISLMYGLYYYGLELLAIGIAIHLARRQKKLATKKALYAFAVGYGWLIIPTTTVNIIDPATIHGIPSIMCGFAVILAIILAGYVVPLVAKKRT